MNQYTPPKYGADAFNCPHCGAFSHQIWLANIYGHVWRSNNKRELDYLNAAKCVKCNHYSLWKIEPEGFEKLESQVMIFPDKSNIENPNEDIPENIKGDYNEASSITNKSVRGAAALLRLCIQKMCIHLGLPGNNLNDDIAKLVKKGLPKKIQKALDTVRVIGNEAVHPGQMDLKDDLDTVNKLFKLINIIAHNLITEPKEIDDVFKKIPEVKKKAIQDRDKKNK